MKVNSVAHEGRVVDEVEARRVLGHVALEQQLLSQLYPPAWLEHLGVPQAVDHVDYVVVKFTESLSADVKGLERDRRLERDNNKTGEIRTFSRTISHKSRILHLCRFIFTKFIFLNNKCQ